MNRAFDPALDPEDAAALAVLDALGRLDSPEDTSVPDPEDEIDQVLRRLFGDAVGMLAYGLEPVAPPLAIKESILSLTVGESTQEVAPIGEAARPEREAEFRPALTPRLFTPAAPEPSSAEERNRTNGRLQPAEGRARLRTGWVGLAAVLALALAGAGFWIAYLQSELAAQGTRLAWAEREWKSQAASARDAARALERRFNLVTSPAVTVFHLRCPSGSGPGATANANVYVSADRKLWELEIQGLAAQPPEREYQLWFLVGSEARSGGCFTMQDGEVALLNPASFPPGTTGIAISLEPKGGSMRPTNPPILVSSEPVRL